MKKGVFLTIILLLFAAACKKQPSQLQPAQNQPTPQSSVDITTSDLVSFFNNKFDCTAPKDPSIGKDCFDQSLKVKTSGAMYDNPVFEFVDFTGDGNKDALVTVPIDGSGTFREFYALSKDPALGGNPNGKIQEAYYNQEAGYPKLENGVYILTCSHSGENRFNGGPPDCTVKIKWDNTEKRFVEQSGSTALSSAYIYGPELNKVKVFLYPITQQVIETPDPGYCGSAPGNTEYRGTYKLVLDPSTASSDNPGGQADIKWPSSELVLKGAEAFVKQQAWDGTLEVKNLGNDSKRFIFIKQYLSCADTGVLVVGYDFVKGQLVQYSFVDSKNKEANSFATSDGYQINKNGDIVTTYYINSLGKTLSSTWRLEESKKIFKEISVKVISK